MSKHCIVYVCKPKSCKYSYNAEVIDDVDGELIYGTGKTAREAIEDMHVMVDEINQSRAASGKAQLDITCEYRYDVPSLFSLYPYLNISEVGKRIGIHPVLMRRYASNETSPSAKRMRYIEDAVKEIASELQSIALMPESRRTAIVS